MSYKNLCAHIDYRPHYRANVDLAFELAVQFDAHLTGIYVDPVALSPEVISMASSPALYDQMSEEQDIRAQEAKTAFELLSSTNSTLTNWQRAQGPMYSTLNLHARYCDMLILNQEGDGDDALALGGFADSAVIETGRPVLVVPFIGAAVPLHGKVLVAWNGSREATRAVNDAMPLLQMAEEVQVVCIDPHTTEEQGAPLPGAELCQHLSTHGVRAVSNVITSAKSDSCSVLLSHAADYGANLIVAGAYGHSRLRELVLGGMTLDLLRHMTVPVLMSH